MSHPAELFVSVLHFCGTRPVVRLRVERAAAGQTCGVGPERLELSLART